MNKPQLLTTALAAAAIAALAAPSAMAQGQAPARGGAAQGVPGRGPIKTPLGRLSQEVLGMKVVVSDMPKSYEFYTKVVGLRAGKSSAQTEPLPPPSGTDQSKWPGEYGMNYSGEFSETFFDLLKPSATRKPTPESAAMTTLMFKVADAPAVIARAKAMGYKVTREAPAVQPGEMSIGMIQDPDGYQVEIIQAASYPK